MLPAHYIFLVYSIEYIVCIVGLLYCAGGKIMKNEMGGACGTYGGGERCAQGSGGET
jgi:hypothetical protein